MSEVVRWRATITYRKTGRLRYLGHLDVARAMERAVRRAALPVAYSEGYNQRMRLSFGPPLPLGAEGEGEIVVATLTAKLPESEVLWRLGAQLPADLGVVTVTVEPAAGPTALNLIRTALWRMQLAAEPSLTRGELAQAAAAVMSAQQLALRDNDKVTDVRQGIVCVEAGPREAPLELTALLGASGHNYLSPDKLLRLLESLLPRPATLRWTRLVRVRFET